jgi:hypothetical protein
MIYRGLYHFAIAHQKGLIDDPVTYFSDPRNRDLGIVKSQRKPSKKLIVAPFPERQKNEADFSWRYDAQILLTTPLLV